MSVYICKKCSNINHCGRTIGEFVKEGNECYNNGDMDNARFYYSTAWSNLDMSKRGCKTCIRELETAYINCRIT
jgi:hypothetical protein